MFIYSVHSSADVGVGALVHARLGWGALLHMAGLLDLGSPLSVGLRPAAHRAGWHPGCRAGIQVGGLTSRLGG